MAKEKNIFREFPPVSRDEWEKRIAKDLHGKDYKINLKWQTGEGIEALPFYRKDNFERTPAPISKTQNDWEIRQLVTRQDITQANYQARKAVKGGADAVTFWLNIQSAAGVTGGNLQGTAIQNQQAFTQLLDGINLKKTRLHFDSAMASPIILALLHNEIKLRNLDKSAVKGSILFDPYSFIITSGEMPTDETAWTDKTSQMVDFCKNHLPDIRCLGVDARVYHNAGATIVQELGYALATGSEYLAALGKDGLDTDDIAPAIHFNFAVGSGYFLEIAKFRAARKLWRSVLDEYKVRDDQQAYLHASTSRWNKTFYDPYVNMLRSTTEGMSAAIAGCDAITVHPFDEIFRQPDNFSQRIARNSQIILKEEAYFNKVTDPGAGSYYIETLTDKIAEAAWDCFQQVEKQGGILKAIREGIIQTEIEESRLARDQAIAKRGRIFVGANQYPDTNDSPREQQVTTPSVSLDKTDKKVEIKEGRLISSLKELLQNGRALGDLAPILFDLKRYDIRTIQAYRGPQAFEELRMATEKHTPTPRVLTVPLGDKKMRKARSAFAVNFFGCAGYHIIDPIGFDSIENAIAEIKNQQPDIVVLCSSDEAYIQLVPKICDRINQFDKKPILVLAGHPKEHIEQYKNAGVDEFIHAQCNVLETLKSFQQKLGVIKKLK